MPDLTLHQFLFSHYNEKIRWALAYKEIAHIRCTYLPGPHIRMIKNLSGQTQTPVLESVDGVIAGSAAIIDWLEKRFARHPLYPNAKLARHQALAWQSTADAELGPAVRAILFAELVLEPDFLCAMFASGKPTMKKFLYRRMFPIAKPMIAKGNGITSQEDVDRANNQVNVYLDQVAQTIASKEYLVGSTFSVADLSVAALIAPLAIVPCDDMRRPEPVPPRIMRFIEQWQSHPAIHWCQRIYELHRSNS